MTMRFYQCFPGAAQREAKRNGALQTRDRCSHRLRNGPGSAVHRFAALALHRIRDTLSGGSPGAPSP